MAGTLKQSTEVMKAMQQLIKVLIISKYQKMILKVPEVMQVMREMAKEMTKMGLIEEVMEETMDALEPEDMEELAQVKLIVFASQNLSIFKKNKK